MPQTLSAEENEVLLQATCQLANGNSEGNTALLLAAAYGHLDIVQWLLLRNRADITEKNNRQSTALSLAATHGQLHIVDYLIRHCYGAQKLDDIEKELYSTSRNKSIRYYFTIFKLLSQQTVNAPEVELTLEKAERSLKNEETSFIYLLCFWMQLRNGVTTLFSPTKGVSVDLCIQKLLPSHQSELILHMIEKNIDTVNWPVIEDDVAKWAAYHLCQQPSATEQQHLKIYARSTGTARLAYYNTVKKCLNDKRIPLQKNDLLPNLGNMPDIDGKRLHWVEEYPNWVQNLGCKLENQEKIGPTLSLVGLEKLVFLHEDICQQIWDIDRHTTKPSALPGNHPVYHLNEHGIYCKLYPGLPGINDALQYLYRRTFNTNGGLPWSVTGLINIDNNTIPVLISEDVGSRVVNNDERLKRLDPYTLSKLILFSILTNPEDGKPDNLTLKINKHGLYDIFSVDNDQALVDSTAESKHFLVFTNKYLAVKSLLFCLDEMKQPLHPKAVSEFLEINPRETLKAWLTDLNQLSVQYTTVFEDCEESCSRQTQLHRRSYLKIVLPSETVIRIAYKLQCLQELLKANSNVYPIRLLERAEPIVASYYLPVLYESSLSATGRFDKLVKNEELYGWDAESNSYSTTLTSILDLYKYMVPDNEPKIVSPQAALNMLEKVYQTWGSINREQLQIIKGEISNLGRLPLNEQQALLKMTHLDQFSEPKRWLFVDAIAKKRYFKEIYLRSPQNCLTNKLLATLLQNNTQLQCLSISKATAVTYLTPLDQLQTLTTLKLTQLPKINEFAVTLPNLTKLTLKDNVNLRTLQLNAPKLIELDIINCPNLDTIQLPKSMRLEKAVFQTCDKLPFTDFYSIWPGFISRFQELPPKFLQRVVHYINNSFVDLTSIPKMKVYDIVTDYLDLLITLSQRISLSKPPYAYSASFALAHFNYDHPLVLNILIDKSLLHWDKGVLDATTDALIKLQAKDEETIQRILKMFHWRQLQQKY